MAERGISVSSVIANPSLPSTQTAMDILHTLSSEAVNQGLNNIVKELPVKIFLKSILYIPIR
jgi:hypothetical protein